MPLPIGPLATTPDVTTDEARVLQAFLRAPAGPLAWEVRTLDNPTPAVFAMAGEPPLTTHVPRQRMWRVMKVRSTDDPTHWWPVAVDPDGRQVSGERRPV